MSGPATRTRRAGARTATVVRTCPSRLRPAAWCMTLGRSENIRFPLPAARTITAKSAIVLQTSLRLSARCYIWPKGMLSKTPHRKGPRPERAPALRREGEAAAARRGIRAEHRPASEDLPADAIIALVAGAGLVLAL